MDRITFDNSYAHLPERFYARQGPEAVSAPGPIRVNRELAALMGVDADWLASDEGTRMVAGNAVPAGAEPIAMAYAGHQFGGFNPQLGDGRALLLGEVVTADAQRFDLQLKGSGPTPWSRGGDGRSAVGPVLREYIVSEAMHRLGVPTTRALAAVRTGDLVVRERYLPGAVLARVASSHIRIGTFEYFAARRDTEALRVLADHVIERHYPAARHADNPVLALLEGVIARQAQLIARWQLLGFIHGVMNTDNMLVCGETIDYGPCAFMDAFNPEQVYSSIDHHGRYAYRRQPSIAHWNLSCLAQSLLPLLHDDEEQAVALAQNAINAFPAQFLQANTQGMARKLGLQTLGEQDTALVEDLWQLMAQHELDFTLTFRRLADLAHEDAASNQSVAALFEFPQALAPWLERWRARIAQDALSGAARQATMYRANPVFIPRNHLVEAAIAAATDSAAPGGGVPAGGDFSVFHALVDVLASPHDYRPELALYATPPRPEQVVKQTFCGT
jgi:serine/tyrosine/threonine adenylyltransferase